MAMAGLPLKSYMAAEMFRPGDIVSPTRGMLRGIRGRVVKVREGRISILFDAPMTKYEGQKAQVIWPYDSDDVRLESFGI